MLLVQADRGLRTVVVLVEQPKKLPVIFPVPAGIVHVRETFILDLACDVVERRKNIGGGRAFAPELFFFWQTQSADAGENFNPRKKEPRRCCDRTEDVASRGEINQQIRNGENGERARFLGERTLKAPQRDGEHRHPKQNEKVKQH